MLRRTAARALLVLCVAAAPLLVAGPAAADTFTGTVTAPADAWVEGDLDLYPGGYEEGDDIFDGAFGNDRVVTADVPPDTYETYVNANLYGSGGGTTSLSGRIGHVQLSEPTDRLDLTLPVKAVDLSLTDTQGQPSPHEMLLYCNGELPEDPEGVRNDWSSYSRSNEASAAITMYQLDTNEDDAEACTLEIDMGEDVPPLRRVVEQDAGSIAITIPDARVQLSGRLDWPSLPVREGVVQLGYTNGNTERGVVTDPDGTWSMLVWPGTYDVHQYAYDEDGNGQFVSRDVVIDGDTVLEPSIDYRPATLYVVNGSGQSIFGYPSAYCRDELKGYGSSLSQFRVAKPGEAVELTGLVADPGWECWITGSNGYDVLKETDWFTVPSGGDLVWTWNTSTGELTEGAPTTDGDAVSDQVEEGAPNGGDGNGDGTPDSDQANVTSLPANGGGATYLTVASPSETTLSDVSTLDPATLPTPPPAGTALPAGLVSFKVNLATPGDTQTVSIYAGSTAGVTGYAKYDPTAQTWSMLPADRVTVLADHVDISLTDGGIGDADGLPNGVITDPGGITKAASTGDTTPPTVTGRATTRPNGNGWYRTDVRIDWTATDPSGVRRQPADTVVTTQGGDVTARSEVVCDKAPTPNCGRGTLTGLKIDKTAPSVSVGGVRDGATYTLGAVPTPSCVASDSLSGLTGACAGALKGGNANKVGQFTYTATATDKAGNKRVVTVRYRVVYRVDGFLPPVNDPAVSPGSPTSVFKAGSIVPAAITLKRANGQVVTPVSKPGWVAPLRGSRTSAAVNEAVVNGKGTSGSTYVPKSSRWQYDWSTKGLSKGYLYRIGVRLDDGTTRYVTVGLR
jgi:hypothetical protein